MGKCQERDTCGVLHRRKSDVRRSAQRSRVRPDAAQNRSVQQQLKIHQNTVYGCNLKPAQRKGVQFYLTRSHAIALFNTLPSICIESGIHEVRRKNCTSKMYQHPELPQRIVLKPNLLYGRQDTTDFEARASVDHHSREYGETRSGREYGETRFGNTEFRIQGLQHSTVQQQDDTRKATTRLQPKITLISRHRQIGGEMKILRSLYHTLRVKNGPRINEMITEKLKELMRDCMKSMERATPDAAPRIKFGNDEVNILPGLKRVPSVSTPKRVGGGTAGGNLHHGMSFFLFDRTQGVFTYRQWRFP